MNQELDTINQEQDDSPQRPHPRRRLGALTQTAALCLAAVVALFVMNPVPSPAPPFGGGFNVLDYIGAEQRAAELRRIANEQWALWYSYNDQNRAYAYYYYWTAHAELALSPSQSNTALYLFYENLALYYYFAFYALGEETLGLNSYWSFKGLANDAYYSQ